MNTKTKTKILTLIITLCASINGVFAVTNNNAPTVKIIAPKIKMPPLQKPVPENKNTINNKAKQAPKKKVAEHKIAEKKVPEKDTTTIQRATVKKIDLSFEQAYELMMANNNAIKACVEEINEKKYLKKSAFGEHFPKVGINSTYTHLSDPVEVRSQSMSVPVLGSLNTPAIGLQDENMWSLNVGAVWNVFTGGKIMALNSAARAKLEGTNNKYKSLTNDLTVELVKRYFGLKMAQQVVVVRQQVLDTTKKHLSDAKKLEAAGIIARSERLHAEVAYAQAKRNYEASMRDEAVVQEGLKTLIKSDKVGDLDDIEIYPSTDLFVYKDEFLELNEFKQIAIKNNPGLKQLEVKKKLAQANYKSKVANYYPTVSLFAYDIPASNDLSYLMPRWQIGAMANWTLFDGLSRYNNVKAADSVRKQVKFEQIDATNNISSLVTKNYEELMKYKEEYESTTKSIESANEALRVSMCAFEEGMGTSLSVTDAQTALLGEKITRLNSIYNYDITLSDLLRTNGTSEKILEYIKNSKHEKL
ncbi:TolC family protein [bacterium]|nr:TolC family protein [bacterium]